MNGPFPDPVKYPNIIGRCWIWIGAKRKTGHGYFWFDGKVDSAHCFAFLFTGIEVPEGYERMHRCDNGSCVNPDHLECGTHKQNMHDAWDRGMCPIGERCTHAKLTDDLVREMRRLNAAGNTNKSIAAKLGVRPSTVSVVVNFKSWKHVK